MDSILKDLSPILQLLMVMAMFSLLPFMFVSMTSFLRYAIVFGFLKQALGAQQIPPPIVLVGLSIILTFFYINKNSPKKTIYKSKTSLFVKIV